MNQELYRGDEILQEPDTEQASEYIASMLETYDYAAGDHTDKPLVGDAIFTILVIEDNLDMQKFLYSQLSDTYRILLAQNGAEGIETCRESMPDLILSDIMMPEIDGFEFCRQIKGDVATSHIPIILLTAKSGAEDQIKGLKEGADDYITKPFSAEALKLKVRNILENRKKLADKFSSASRYIPENIKISQIDQGFLEKLIKLVEDNIDDSELSGDVIAAEMGMSKGNLYKKLKILTGMTVNIFVRTIRLKVAARLLKQGKYNISEIAYAVGFNNPKYFSTCFSEMFSVSPKEYMK
jgi:CheY-like chemotaxis protein